MSNLGHKGELYVVSRLREQGYDIVATNHRTKFGEIDIIAKEDDTWCFIEVKTRSSDKCGDGLEAITSFKQRHMIKAALSYLAERDLLDEFARFDVVAVAGDPQTAPSVEIIKNAFELGGEQW